MLNLLTFLIRFIKNNLWTTLHGALRKKEIHNKSKWIHKNDVFLF